MRKLLKQALDALESANCVLRHNMRVKDAIDAIRNELAKPKPEPVGYVNSDELDNILDDRAATLSPAKSGWYTRPLYTKEEL